MRSTGQTITQRDSGDTPCSVRHQSNRGALPLGAMLLFVVVIGACASHPKLAVQPATQDVFETEARSSAWGQESGLEIRTWLIRDTRSALAQALAPYLDEPIPLDDSTRRIWRANGLRMIRVPLADVPMIRSRFNLVGRIQRNWIGQTPRWARGGVEVKIAPGERFAGRKASSLRDPAVLRLILRTWLAPTSDEPTLRTDLAFQRRTIKEHRPFQAPVLQPVIEQGGVFEDLTASMAMMAPDVLYFIVPEKPEVDWRSSSDDDPDTDDSASSDVALGPLIPAAPTIGERLLSDGLNPAPGEPVMKRLVLLVPHRAAAFRLLK